MNERDELEQAITKLESQRADLGDAAVNAALAGIHRRLSHLDQFEIRKETKPEIGDRGSERRLVTILFCDVVGSTALAEGMDPEAWTEIMNAVFEYLIEPVERYGGTIARLMGDAILAFFGAPTAHEDDPQRAVLAGLEIVEKISPFREKLRRENKLNFNVRVGINTGLVVVGDVGSKATGEYTAMGDAVNVAARMEQTAAPGSVQIAQNTYNLVAPIFECKALGGITVKGKREPVPAYQVLVKKTEPSSLRGFDSQGISSPLVGRLAEFKSAQHTIEQLLAGRGSILAIRGEAGIGKSRLVTELRENLVIKNIKLTWLESYTLSYGQTISYWPFQQIFREYAGISEEDRESTALIKFEQKIKGLFAEETVEILPYLASLLSINVGDDYAERVKYLDGEALRIQIYRASWLFFHRLAERSPLVLLFDDLHWMDTSSAGLLEHLLPLIQRVPLLICVLSRPDAETPAARLLKIATELYENHLTIIDLPPLSLSDSKGLVQNLLEIDSLPEQSQQMMLAMADGNPLFLEEIVRNLIGHGALVQDTASGRWQATQQIEKVTVPDTIQGLLIARIDRLDEDLKRVVRSAAVIGRAFLYRVLNAVLANERNLEQQLDQLQQVELIQERKRIPELEYIFKHALAQEVAYDSLLLQERREVHAQVGAAIERLYADRLDEFYSMLAYHYSAAMQWDHAQEYLFKAADQAGRLAADAEALALYRQAMEAYARVRGEDWQPLERAQLDRKIGEAFYRLGNFSQARIYLTRSLALLGETFPDSKWGTRLAIFQALVIQFFHRLFPSYLVRPLSDSSNPEAEELTKAAFALGWIEGVSDVERLFLISIRMLNANERRGFAYGSTYLASTLSTAFDLMGWYSLVNRYARLATQYSRYADPQRPILQVDWSRAFHYNIHSDYKKSIDHARSVVEIARSTGDLRMYGSGLDFTAWAQLFQGKLNESFEINLEMIKVAEEGSDQQLLSWGLMGLGVTLRRLGQIDEAISKLEKAIEVSKQVPDYHSMVAASAWLGRFLIINGEITKALTLLETNREVLSAQGIVIEIPILGNSLSEAYLASAELTTGKKRQAWLKKAKHSCQDTLKASKRYRPPMMDALLLQGRLKWLQGNRTAAEKWWERALDEAHQTHDPYSDGIVHLEIGQRLGERGHLLHAESVLEKVGAEYDLAITRKALAAFRED
jgi:class 3 adenylate cyclase/tetratricopeptide (TPR) repeat protein